MKSILLIGLGRFGTNLAMELNDLGHQVMAVDSDETRLNAVMPYVTDGMIGDSTNVQFLESLGIPDFDICFVAIGNDFQSSLETTYNLKELGAKLVVSRASQEVQQKFLLRNGADEVIYPEKQIAKWAAVRWGIDHILSSIDLDEDHAIVETTIPPSWEGKTIGQLDIRRKYDINILAVKRDGKMDVMVTPDTVMTADRTLLALGEVRALRKCFRT